MSVMSIRINDEKRKLLKVLASVEGETISAVISKLIDGYIEEKKGNIIKLLEADEMKAFTKISEPSFKEWDSDEDEIYNDM
jgi:TRAP-type C4-dicarboxylate transport system substrate-binding protein